MEVVSSGQGGAASTAQLGFDIQYLKAVDWLVERRVVAKTWPKALKTVHAKLEAALEARLPDEVPGVAEALPSRTQQGTTYFECAHVVKLLHEANLGSKNLIGQYTNPHMARWADVVKRYEAGHIFLVDTAQYLIHNCSYELPALKKEMGRAEKELAELQRRQAEYTRLAEASRARFTATCTRKQIPPCDRDELKAELRGSLAQLRPLYDRVARLAQLEPLPSACRAYKTAVEFALEKAAAVSASGAAPQPGKAKGKPAAAAPTASPGATSAAALPLLSRLQGMDLAAVSFDAAATGGAAGGAAAGGAAAGGAAEVEIDWGGGGGGGGGGEEEEEE